MADIQPFRAIRYQPTKIESLSAVVAPPYDVISPEHQDALYARHPKNIVRVDLNRTEPADGELSRYDRAAALYQSWLGEGTLAKDASPAYYVLSQTFTGPDGVERTRTGFFSRVRLTRFGEGPVLPHERTLTGPKLDRLRLFRATKANLSPVFMMYEDQDQEVLRVLESVRGEPRLAEATMDGVVNRVWAIRDADRIDGISRAIKPKKLYIADGHHRYETGLAYRDERRMEARSTGSSDTPAYDSILTFSAAVEDPGMVVFPTHRIVHGLERFDGGAFRAQLSRYFDIQETPRNPSIVDALRSAAHAGTTTPGARIAFALIAGPITAILTLRPEAPLLEVGALPSHPLQQKLDVTILHSVILEHLLGISKEAQASQENLRYSKDAKDALAAAQAPGVNAVFLMNPTRIDQVIDISNAGEIMPQKSTFFFPKIPSGLVLYPLDD